MRVDGREDTLETLDDLRAVSARGEECEADEEDLTEGFLPKRSRLPPEGRSELPLYEVSGIPGIRHLSCRPNSGNSGALRVGGLLLGLLGIGLCSEGK